MSGDTDQELVTRVAKGKADQQMDDFIADFENRIRAIQDAKPRVGREGAVAQYVPTCKSFSNLYCLGTYTYSLNAAMQKNGDNPKDGGFLDKGSQNNPNTDYHYSRWGSPQTSTYAAITYFDTNKNEDFKKCGQSLKDMPPGTTLGDMLKQGYENGSIPVGSLVMVQRVDKEGNTGLHATMFAGFNENGEPLFSCANPEMIRQPCSKWANQTVESRRGRDKDCYVINMHQALETKIEMSEREKIDRDREAYCAEHGAEIMAMRREKYGEAIKIDPIKIDQPILVAPEVGPVKLDIKPIEPPKPEKTPVLKNVATKIKGVAQKTGEAFADVGQKIGDKARAVHQEIRDKFPSDGIKNVATKIKDAAQKTGEALAEVGQRIGEKARAVRQEIRARAKARCEKKTLARIERRRQREENLQARTPHLMKTLLRNAPAQDYMAEAAPNTPKVQRSPVSVAMLRNRMAGRV